MNPPTGTFVTPAWLAAHLDDPSVVVVEASFYLPDEGKDADALFAEAHIPGAVRLDIDKVCDRSNDLPHMLPDAATFERMVGALGIGNANTIVVYDATDLLGGARAWWMLRHFGAETVRLLEGGFASWLREELPVAAGHASRPAATFRANVGDPDAVVDAAQVLDASRSGSAQIVDARSAQRFGGSVAEPRPGLRSGHIPGALNVPWRNLLDANGRLRSSDELAAAFRKAGLDTKRPIITSCGSGVSAVVLLLALEQLGVDGASLYDGSWSEWGARPDLPIESQAVQA